MRIAVSCDHCKKQHAPLLFANHITEPEEAMMRNHLRGAHPALMVPLELAPLLAHFTIIAAASPSKLPH